MEQYDTTIAATYEKELACKVKKLSSLYVVNSLAPKYDPKMIQKKDVRYKAIIVGHIYFSTVIIFWSLGKTTTAARIKTKGMKTNECFTVVKINRSWIYFCLKYNEERIISSEKSGVATSAWLRIIFIIVIRFKIYM
ncbi:MAG: hypothetical protein KQH53_08375 [Desulfarculaceae bacterium]|nr:hypothetical protein [Desulfarculaceae bacterium]